MKFMETIEAALDNSTLRRNRRVSLLSDGDRAKRHTAFFPKILLHFILVIFCVSLPAGCRRRHVDESDKGSVETNRVSAFDEEFVVIQDLSIFDDGLIELREIVKFDGEAEEIELAYHRSDLEIVRKYLTPTMCEILGYVQDYRRGDLKEEDDDLIEAFFPSEKKQAEKFLGLLQTLVEETGVSTEIKKELKWEEHIYYRSKELARMINSFYVKDSKSGYYRLDMDIFAGPYRKYKLHFLRGAHYRHGINGRNMFHLAPYKSTDNITFVLKGLHCNNIRIVRTVDMLPTATTILFRPTDTVKEFLGIRECVNIFLDDMEPNDRDLPAEPWIWKFEEND